MALNKITYTNKETLVDLPSVQAKNKCTANDLNEIKNVVNATIDQVDTNTSDIGNMKTSISGALQSLSNIMDYSTTEKVVGTWLDGKPIYRTTVILNNKVFNNSTVYPHGIANISLIVNYSMEFKVQNYANFNNVAADADGYLVMYCDSTNIKFYGTTYFNAGEDRTIYATIWYTKTTD